MLLELGEPTNEKSRFFLEQLSHAIDGATDYWRRVHAAVEEAEVELKIIEGGR
jgi:hypothetical protein